MLSLNNAVSPHFLNHPGDKFHEGGKTSSCSQSSEGTLEASVTWSILHLEIVSQSLLLWLRAEGLPAPEVLTQSGPS